MNELTREMKKALKLKRAIEEYMGETIPPEEFSINDLMGIMHRTKAGYEKLGVTYKEWAECKKAQALNNCDISDLAIEMANDRIDKFMEGSGNKVHLMDAVTYLYFAMVYGDKVPREGSGPISAEKFSMIVPVSGDLENLDINQGDGLG